MEGQSDEKGLEAGPLKFGMWAGNLTFVWVLVWSIAQPTSLLADVVRPYDGTQSGNLTSYSGIGVPGVNSSRAWGQSFTNTTGSALELFRVQAYLSNSSGTLTGNFKLSLFQGSRTGGYVTPSGNALFSTGNIDVATLGLSGTAAPKEISISTNTATPWLIDNSATDYVFVFDGTGITAGYFNLHDSAASVSGQNLAYSNDLSNWWAQGPLAGSNVIPTSAMVIFANTVPEPGTLVLMGLAQSAAGAWWWRKKRRVHVRKKKQPPCGA
jgi:PEP-CTERM motif